MSEATFTIGSEDLAAANRLHFIKLFSAERWSLTFIGSAVALALLNFGFDAGIDLEDYLLILGSIWAIIVAICVLGWFMIPRQARRTWGQAKKLWIEQNVKWDSDRIHFKSTRGESHVLWSDYHRWAADDRSILLYQDERTFFLLPVRQFPVGTRETITDYLKLAGVAER